MSRHTRIKRSIYVRTDVLTYVDVRTDKQTFPCAAWAKNLPERMSTFKYSPQYPPASHSHPNLKEMPFYQSTHFMEPYSPPASQPAGQAGSQPSTVQVKTFLYEFEYEHRRMGGMGEWLDDCYSVYCVVHAYTFAQTNKLVKMSYSQWVESLNYRRI